MEARMASTSGGSFEIKMDYEALINELENSSQSLKPLKMPTVYTGINGQNKLQFIDEWIKRENEIRTLLIEYVAIVEQNIADTKANAKTLKAQDEAITRG